MPQMQLTHGVTFGIHSILVSMLVVFERCLCCGQSLKVLEGDPFVTFSLLLSNMVMAMIWSPLLSCVGVYGQRVI